LTGKVGKIIEIYNPNRWMTFGGMGSQKLDAPNIEYIVNNDTHPGAQFNEQFRSVVKSELVRLSAQDNLQTAQAKAFKPSPLAKLSPLKNVKSPWHSLRRTRPNTSRQDTSNPNLLRRKLSLVSSKKRQPFLPKRRSRSRFWPMRRGRSQFLLMRF
jgi:hypothetical protein